MIVTKNQTLTLLASCIAILAFASSGCRSAGFDKPNLDVLKFWKAPGEVASKTPPPPARYFDPAPIHEEQLAQKQTEEKIDLNSQRLKDKLDQAIAQHNSPAAIKANSDVLPLNKVAQDNQFSNPAEATKKNLQTALQGSVKNAGSTTKALDLDLKSPIPTPPLNQSLSGLKKSIYDADGKLVKSSSQVKESILSKLDPTRNSVPGAKMNDFIAAANAKAARVSAPNSNDFNFNAPTLPKSAPIANPFAAAAVAQTPSASNAELKLVQAQVIEANRQIEQLKQQIALSTNRPTPPPVATVAPPNTPKIPAPSNSFAATPQRAPAEQVAQLQTPRFGNSNYSAIGKPKPENSFVSNSPTNILRASQTIQQPKPIQPVASNIHSAFPSTPHGNFAPDGKFGSTFVPKPNLDQAKHIGLIPQPAAPVNFQTEADNSMTLKASTPFSIDKPTANVQQIKSHTSSVDIPASILNGSGSYAPGSVRQVGQ